jgi:hypothetical protein
MRLPNLLAPVVLFALAVTGCAPAVSSPVTTAGKFRPVHLEPAFVDEGLTLSLGGTLSGLANEATVIELAAVGRPAASCTAEGQPKQAAAQNPPQIALGAKQKVPVSDVHDGKIELSLKTAAPTALDVEDAPGCPSTDWTERVDGVALESAILTVEQAGAVVATVTCIFGKPTVDGRVPSSNVTCSSN